MSESEYVWTCALTPEKEPWGIIGVFPKALVDAAPVAKDGRPILGAEHIILGNGPGWDDNFIYDEEWLIEACKRMKGWTKPV